MMIFLFGPLIPILAGTEATAPSKVAVPSPLSGMDQACDGNPNVLPVITDTGYFTGQYAVPQYGDGGYLISVSYIAEDDAILIGLCAEMRASSLRDDRVGNIQKATDPGV